MENGVYTDATRWGFAHTLLNNLPPRNRAFRYLRVIALISIAPIPHRRCGWTGIRRVIVPIVVAAVIRSRRQRSPKQAKANTEAKGPTPQPPP